jgi:serine protease
MKKAGSMVIKNLRYFCLIGVIVLGLMTTVGTGGGGSPTNNAPVANAGSDQNVNTGSLVTLNGSGSSDPDGDAITYNWSFVSMPGGSSATFANSATENPTFTADVGGTYEISLVVNDGSVESTPDIVNIIASYTISGSIFVSANTAVDSDVNDLNAPYIPNDSFDTAQVISSPVALGGYVNVAGTGEDGRSYADGDRSDFFRVALSANQTIILYIADDMAATDLNLYLYPGDNPDINNPLDASVGTDVIESLFVSTAGDYFVEVYSDSGASNYTLTIGQSAPAVSSKSLRLSSEFVPYEVIVRFKNDIFPAGAMASPTARALSVGMAFKSGALDREMLLTCKDDAQKTEAFRMLGIKQTRVGMYSFQLNDSPTQHKLDTLQIIKALRSRSDVIYAEPNYIRKAFATPNDVYYSLQWHYPLINLSQAWDISTGSSNVIVAVIDTGVLVNHPDLVGQLTSDGYDFISDVQIAADGDGIDDNPDDPGDDTQGGSSFHGTHVAGSIAAATNNTVGVAGIAWSTKIMPLRVLGIGGGTSYDIHQAIRYAAGLYNDSGMFPINKADIINLSLGGGGYSQTEQDAYTAARNAGVIIIAAAGNESTSQLSYPASYDGVVSVSAVDMNTNLAPYSNYGTKIDVAAPGGDTSKDLNGDGYPDGVLSTCGDDSSGTIQNVYKFYQGTSMASPHMAGVVALMKAVYPDLTPGELDSSLWDGTIITDLGDPGRDDLYGYGLIDAYKAVLAAQDLGHAGPLPIALVVIPSSLDFGSIQPSATLTAQKQGDGSLIVDSVSDNATWLSVSEETVDGNGLGTYTAQVDRTGLEDGSYTATITFTSSENPVAVPVSMKVETSVTTGDAGHHYVLLLDPDTFENKGQVGVDAANGVYTFNLTQVPEGYYMLYAGTDFDNDYIVGDAGEALGAYYSLDTPSIIWVNDNLSGLDFNTSFNVNLPSASSQSEGEAENRRVLYRMERKHIPR